MLKLFIFSDGYTSDILLKSLKYIIRDGIEMVIVLKENYQTEIEPFFDFPIKICDNIMQAFELSNAVLAIENPDIPAYYIQLLEEKCALTNKSYIKVPLSDEEMSPSYFEKTVGTTNGCPVILQLAIGEGTQIEYGEFLLNNIISELDIEFSQLCTDKTKSIFECLYDKGILSEKIQYKSIGFSSEAKLLMISLKTKSIIELSDYALFFKKILPDYIIVHVSKGYLDYNQIEIDIKNVCCFRPNIIVESNYHVVDKDWVVLCDENIEENDNIININFSNLKEEMMNKILTHFTLPKGIVRI